MPWRKKRWPIASIFVFTVLAGGLYIAASILARRVEPYIRAQAMQYLRERFNSDVELGRLQVHVPPALPLRLLFRAGRGALAQVDGTGLSLRFHGRSDAPPILAIKHPVSKSISGRFSIRSSASIQEAPAPRKPPKRPRRRGLPRVPDAAFAGYFNVRRHPDAIVDPRLFHRKVRTA